jgi:hypothetical protein
MNHHLKTKMNRIISHRLNGIHGHARRSAVLCASVLFMCARLPAQDQDADVVKIHVDPNTTISRISPDFIGFGYETSAVAQSNFFTAKNVTMAQLCRNLSSHGLIRIGGIISDHAKYVPDGTPVVETQKGVTIFNRGNLADLGDFARATGWKVMWGLNLGTGSKEEAAQQALAVNAALGSSLQSFQIGNEVEDLRRFGKSYEAYHAAFLDYKLAVNAALGSSLQSFQIGNEVEDLRRFGKSYEAYHAAFLDYKAAILEVAPEAPFSGPDSVGNLAWITNFAAAEAGSIKLLTIHYYRGGAGDPKSTLEKLLQRDDKLENRLEGMREVCRAHNLKFRINEVNSFSGGGKAGVSDTFGSALWCLDYMFRLAAYGCEGVNMETDINQLGFISHYSPIVHDEAGRCSARPEYYGMLAFATAGKGDMVQLTLDKDDINLTAYATKDEQGLLWLTIINKDFYRDAAVQGVLTSGRASAEVLRLQAPSMESRDQVTFAGTQVSVDGKWAPGPTEKLRINGGALNLMVPHASAALVCLRP